MIKIFSLARVNVSLSMSYPLLFVLCYFWTRSVAEAILTAFAITLSVLIHEFGHALACKRYDLAPSIVIHLLGGACYHTPSGSDKKEAVVVVSGPLLQIVAGLLVLGAMFMYGLNKPDITNALVGNGVTALLSFGVTFTVFSLFWGFLNLLAPVWPLDGGKLFALILRRFTDEGKAARVTLVLGMGLLILAGMYSLLHRQMLLGFIVISLFMQNLQHFQAGSTLFMHSSGKAPKRKMSEFGKDLLHEARAHFDDEDYREAARLCHQLRASGEPISPKQLDEIWQILGLATMEAGDYEEALEWLERAPKTPRIEAAIARCKEHQPLQ